MKKLHRIILFRGYNAKNKTWLHGYYIQNRLGHFVTPNEFARGKDWDDYEVDPDTVGQFTGTYDKTGAMVYEGDIVDAWSAGSHISHGIVKFASPRFFILVNHSEKGTPIDCWSLAPSQFDGNDEYLKVVGNIHDNPDLVKAYLEYQKHHV